MKTTLTINEEDGKFNFAGGIIETNGNVSVQSDYLEVTGTGDATDASGDTGALRIEGGASIAKRVFVGGNISGSSNLILSGDGIGYHLSASNGNLQLSGSSAGNLFLSGSITASSNISSSGNIFGDNFTARNDITSSDMRIKGTAPFLHFEESDLSNAASFIGMTNGKFLISNNFLLPIKTASKTL